MPTLAEDAVALLHAAEIPGPVAVLGYSMGFQVALEVYRAHPEHVAGMIDLAGPVGQALHTFQGTDVFARWLPLLVNASRVARRLTDDLWKALVPHRIAREIGLVTAVNGQRLAPEYLERYMRDLSEIHPELFLSMLTEADAHDGGDVLPTIDVPTLFLAGARDSFVPLRVLEAAAEAVPDARIEIFDDATHALPAEFVEDVTAHLQRMLFDVDAHASTPAAPD